MKDTIEAEEAVRVDAPEVERISLHGWLIILTIFTIDALVSGGRALFLVVILLWEKDFGWNIASLSSLMAVVHVCNGIFTPLSGYLIDRKYPPYVVLSGGIAFISLCFACTAALSEDWQVWLVYGVMSGSAYGIVNLNVFSAAVIRCVPRSRSSFAVGLVTSGSTFGHFTLVPCFSLVSQSYGWRSGYAVLAISTFLLIIPTALLLKSINLEDDAGGDDHDDNAKNNDNSYPSYDMVGEKEMNDVKIGGLDTPTEEESGRKKRDKLLLSEDDDHINYGDIDDDDDDDDDEVAISNDDDETACKDESDLTRDLRGLFVLPQYWALMYSFIVCGITTTGFIETHLISLATLDREENMNIAALAFSVLSAINGLCMIIVGHLSDLYNRHNLLGFIFGFRGVVYMLLLIPVTGLINQRIILFTFASLFGIVDYSVVPLVVSIVKSLVGDSGVGLGVGVLLLCHSIGASIGSYAGGAFFERDDNYGNAIILCGVLCISAAAASVSMSSCGDGSAKFSPYLMAENEPGGPLKKRSFGVETGG